MKLTKLAASAITFSLLSLSQSLFAAALYTPNPVTGGNAWDGTFYLDNTTTHAAIITHSFCFFPAGTNGTHQEFYWVSTTFPDWNGYGAQEGDQLFMYGDFGANSGHDGAQWEIVSDSPRNTGGGHWHEWVENKTTGAPHIFTSMKFQRVGKCKYATLQEALDAGQALQPSINLNGQYLSPMGGVLK